MPRLAVEQVTKYYGDRLVLDGVSLNVGAHEVVALIGASGSGKSTLLRCINRLVECDAGRILLDGIPIDDESFGRVGLYKRIGIVFQAFNLFPHLNVVDNITLAPRKVHGLSRRESEEQALELLGMFGMADCARSYPEQLSGGQQQRVAVIRSLATRPDVLLLDEVTGALDPELIGEVLKIIRDLKDKGMTMIIVTHEMAFARDVSDRVCFLEGGRILEENRPSELFSRPQNPRTQRFLQRIIEAGRL
ncbi:MAG: amino acid ABC transporter ATP-binding protein [Bauldia sp.]